MLKVAVVGAGVNGLSSALEIQEKFGENVRVTVFSKDFSPNTTGDISAGLWLPYLLQNTPEEKITKWSKATHDYFLHLWKSGKAEETGLCLLPYTTLCTTTIPSHSWTKIVFGYQNLSSHQLEEFKKISNVNYKEGFTCLLFTCEVTKFLHYLQKIFLTNGGEIIQKEILNFDQLQDFDLIVNCVGIGARNLAWDELVEPIRGQIARISAPWQFSVLTNDENYIIPNTKCVILGGTHQENDYNINVYPEDTKHILTGCQNLAPSLKDGKLLKHEVGLRPGRPNVRIELEKRGSLKIIHNYGHGGSGVTLCKGCALEVCDLVQIALNLNTSKL